MAFLDDNDDALVLRLVYAGPPMSGKTETVRALSRLLLGVDPSEAVFTPGEANERTLFFDWLEYAGGMFQGRRVRCQIVSVPGQNLLHRRRRALLDTADAIVFVVDAHAEQHAAITRSYDELREITAALAEPIGVVVQANKSDLPDAMDREELSALLGDDPNMMIIPSVATRGTGVREAFVRAVGLGLARAHAQMAASALSSSGAMASSGQVLLQQLMRAEDAEFGAVNASARRDAAVNVSIDADRDHFDPEKIGAIIERHALRGTEAQVETSPESHGGPAPPDDRLDAGMVWPPIAGRVILHEISAPRPLVSQAEDLSWVAQSGERWQLLSLPQHCFPTQEAARDELLQQARTHSQLKSLLSEHRCLCAAPTGFGDWRLWQVVRRETTLADIVGFTLRLRSADSIATELLRVGRLLVKAADLFRKAGLTLRPTLDALAVSHGTPVFTRYLLPGSVEPNAYIEYDPVGLLRRELREAVRTLASRARRAPPLLRQLEAARAAAPSGDIVPETLIDLFLQNE